MHMGKQEQSYVTEKGEGHVISQGSSRDVMSATSTIIYRDKVEDN